MSTYDHHGRPRSPVEGPQPATSGEDGSGKNKDVPSPLDTPLGNPGGGKHVENERKRQQPDAHPSLGDKGTPESKATADRVGQVLSSLGKAGGPKTPEKHQGKVRGDDAEAPPRDETKTTRAQGEPEQVSSKSPTDASDFAPLDRVGQVINALQNPVQIELPENKEPSKEREKTPQREHHQSDPRHLRRDR